MKQELQEIRNYLSDPNHWTQGVYARDKLDKPCSTEMSYAYKFCLVGALIKFAPKMKVSTHLHKLLDKEFKSLTGFNDTVTHLELIEFLDKAIEQAP